MVLQKKRPFPKCTQIVPQYVAYWNKTKVFIDVMSRYILHIKNPFKRANPILQLVVRNIMYMVVNGFLSSQYQNLAQTEWFKDETMSYVELKNKLSNKGSLRKYIYKVMKDFQIPSYRARAHIRLKPTPQKLEFCNEEPGKSFDGMPMHRQLNDIELTKFKTVILDKNKGHAKLFLQPGLARKVRLSKDYVHTNSRLFSKNGVKCMLCSCILKESKGTSTTK